MFITSSSSDILSVEYTAYTTIYERTAYTNGRLSVRCIDAMMSCSLTETCGMYPAISATPPIVKAKHTSFGALIAYTTALHIGYLPTVVCLIVREMTVS